MIVLWVILGLAAAVWLWGQVPPKMNMRWRDQLPSEREQATPGGPGGPARSPGMASTTPSGDATR